MKKQLILTVLVVCLGRTAHAQLGENVVDVDTTLHWTLQQIQTNQILDRVLFFANSDTGWVGGKNNLYLTTDGGNHWVPYLRADHQPFYFKDTRTFYCYQNDSLLTTTDAGQHWFGDLTGFQGGPREVIQKSPDTIYANGTSQFGWSYDGGRTWSVTPLTYGIDKMSWFSSSRGITIEGSIASFPPIHQGDPQIQCGRIEMSKDGGQTWALECDTVYAPLHGCSMVTDNIAVVVGGHGAIARTSDFGKTWKRVYSGPDIALGDVTFLNADKGFVVGDGGSLLRTSDGGQTWLSQTTGTDRDLYRIFFLNDSIGFISGDSGTVLRTSNGGQAWVASSTNQDPLSIQLFPNPSSSHLTISYRLTAPTTVILNIYDNNGAMALSAGANELEEIGYHTTNLDLHLLPAGAYHYTMNAGSQSQSGSFTIIK